MELFSLTATKMIRRQYLQVAIRGILGDIYSFWQDLKFYLRARYFTLTAYK